MDEGAWTIDVKMLKIDAHQHFWHFDPVRDSWITQDMSVIRRDFLPQDLGPVLQQHGFDGCVAVQADQSPAENMFLLANASGHDFIKGVVGWVDLWAEDVAGQLEALQPYPKLKGFRAILQGAADPALMLQPAFQRGLGQLRRYGYTYDILIYANQLPYIPELVGAFPDQPFVVDHLAKPGIKSRDITDWRREIQAVAAHENVFCKVSGLVTEADWRHWQPADFRPYLDAVVAAFGPERLMYGSDWPVCLVAASYSQMLRLVQDYFAAFSPAEQDLIFGGNAVKFYGL
jgi:L-fuconolactonase